MKGETGLQRAAEMIFRRRFPLLLLLTLVTVFLGFHAGRLQVKTDFARMIPEMNDNDNQNSGIEFWL